MGPRSPTEIRTPKPLALYLRNVLTTLSRFNGDNNNNNENKALMLHSVLESLFIWSAYSLSLWKIYPSAILQYPELNNTGEGLTHSATRRKVAGSIRGEVIGIFHLLNLSGRSIGLGTTQSLIEISSCAISWGGGIKAAGA